MSSEASSGSPKGQNASCCSLHEHMEVLIRYGCWFLGFGHSGTEFVSTLLLWWSGRDQYRRNGGRYVCPVGIAKEKIKGLRTGVCTFLQAASICQLSDGYSWKERAGGESYTSFFSLLQGLGANQDLYCVFKSPKGLPRHNLAIQTAVLQGRSLSPYCRLLGRGSEQVICLRPSDVFIVETKIWIVDFLINTSLLGTTL